MPDTVAKKPAEQPPLGGHPASEKVLDTAIEYTFPASDPLSIQESYDRACRREERKA